MTYPYEPVDGIQALVIWLDSLPPEVRANRPPGGALPFYMITRPTVSSDGLTEHGIYRVHAFDEARGGVSALKNAYDASINADKRIMALAPRFGPQLPVTVDGRVVYADNIVRQDGPTREKYVEDGSIERFVTEYAMDWRLVRSAP